MEFIDKIFAFLKQDIVMAVIVSLYMLIELWLGKTEIVKPGSVLEAVLLFIKKVLGFIKGKVDPKPPVEPKV